MTPSQHAETAERLIEQAESMPPSWPETHTVLMAAQAHATLALRPEPKPKAVPRPKQTPAKKTTTPRRKSDSED